MNMKTIFFDNNSLSFIIFEQNSDVVNCENIFCIESR